MKDAGSELIIVYGSVADKDVDSVLHLMPEDAVYIFTQAQSKRALAAEKICEKYLQYRPDAAGKNVFVKDNVADAVASARKIAAEMMALDQSVKPVIYIGGSTYVVSEAVRLY
jgi:dihydrofolate synthase/folylpolyglutamate synthase